MPAWAALPAVAKRVWKDSEVCFSGSYPVQEHSCAVNPPSPADYPRSIAYIASHLPPCFGQGDAWSCASKYNECHSLQILRRRHVPFSINCFIQKKPLKTRVWSFSLTSRFRLPTKAFVCWEQRGRERILQGVLIFIFKETDWVAGSFDFTLLSPEYLLVAYGISRS